MAEDPVKVQCPFCGAPETERINMEGHRFLVFSCMFTPEVDPALDESALPQHLAKEYGPNGNTYFRRQCDRLHLVVTRPPGGGSHG
ncbi:MAG: hypothetical protein L3J87_02830 [Thermoplasmata archaeon]|nr:hypothetical protein [Thermoplasmata archaeon]MCI4344543.1 hypothetical protein [Thermoplasmata archaeon]